MVCVNCLYSNDKYNTKYDTNHYPSDMEKCDILKNKRKKYIDSTDYPLNPTLPTTKPTRMQRTYSRQPPDSATTASNDDTQEKP